MVQMRGSRNFHWGGGGGGQMVNFKEIYRFSRLQMGSNFFQGVQLFPGGVQLLIPYRNPFNL